MTRPENQWSGFYMIETVVMKELKKCKLTSKCKIKAITFDQSFRF